MDRHHLKKIDLYVILWGALLTSGSVFFWDFSIIMGVFIGALIASLNWVGFRFLLSRLMEGATRKRAHYIIAFVLKILAVLSVVGAVIAFAPVNPFAFVAGLSSLMAGIFTGSLKHSLQREDAALEKEV